MPPTPQLQLPEKPGYAQHWDEPAGLLRLQVPDGEVLYAPHFFAPQQSDDLLDYLLASASHEWRTTDWRTTDPAHVQWQNVRWQQEAIKLYGKNIPVPRLTAWHGDPDCPYTYSGLTLQPQPWNEGLRWLQHQLETVAGVRFNSVLLNWYRDGQDAMGWHADDEKSLGLNPVIGSVNFGATRRFLLRRRADPTQKLELPLHHGTLLLMRGALQHHWQHAVPKEARVKEPRLNLTFRPMVERARPSTQR